MVKRTSSIENSSSISSSLPDPAPQYRDHLNRMTTFLRNVYSSVVRFLKWLKSKSFIISSVIFILMDVMTTVFYKRLIDHTRNYVMFTLQVVIFTFWSIISLLALFCWVFKREYMKRPFNTKPLLFLGFLDMLSTGLSATGSAHTSGLMLVLLGQISVPLTMLSCKLFLSKKYHLYQYISSAIILIFAILKPMLHKTDTKDNRMYNNMLYLAASVPDSVASALREKQYTSKFFHVIKYQFFGFTFHFFYNILYTMITTIPSTGLLRLFPSLVDLYVDGFKCLFMRTNTIVDNCGPSMVPTCDNCKEALKIYMLYTLCSSLIRVAYVFIMLDGSVTFTLLLGTVKVPLTSIAFSLHFIAGDSTTKLNFMDVVCFLGIVLGLLLYALGSKKMQEESELHQPPILEEPDDPLLRGTEHLLSSETGRELFT